MELVFLRPIFDEYGAPHLNQTAYQRGMSCNNATFVVQESIRKYLQNGDSIFQIFYDLEKVFDSIVPSPANACLQSWYPWKSMENNTTFLLPAVSK